MNEIPKLKPEEIVYYLRKSRTDDPVLTIPEVLARHEERLDRWVEQNVADGPVPEKNRYRDVGSGETFASRPRMQELLRRVESPKVRAVLVVECARLGRPDLEEIGYLVKILRYTNTIVITLDRGAYDLNLDRDRDDFERELMRGNDYLEYTKKILSAGKLQSARQGNLLGMAPYGYKKIEVKENGRSYYTMEPDPDRADAIRQIFEMYSQGLGYTSIAKAMEAAHFPPPRGKRWSPASIRDILTNIQYLGKIKWQSRKTIMHVEDGEVIKSYPRMNDYFVFEGKHPAIISQELWDSVQALRGKIPRSVYGKELTNPLSGIMRCSCGRMMTRQHYRNPDGTERATARFFCNDRLHCGVASASHPVVMAEVERVLRETIHDFEVQIKNNNHDCVDAHHRLIERLEKKVSDLKDVELKQWDEKIKGLIPPHVFDKLNERTVADLAEAQQALYEAVESMPEPVDLQERLITFQDALAAIKDPDAPIPKVNMLLKSCFESITYHRDKYSNTSGNRKRGAEPTPIQMHFTLRI